ncbi:MAG: ABC transporter ATP-binding protein [Rhodobacteraceae bacterium]|nr:ABC transporter ATP-binding protein [Paracoccaceae bacterium]
MSVPVLDIRDLRLAFQGFDGRTEALKGISLSVNAEERVALVGESGSGKSVTARAVLGLIQERRDTELTGSIAFEGTELARLSTAGRRRLRGNRISMIFQDPVSSLNPVYRIGAQFLEVIRRREPRISKREGCARAAAKLSEVSITEPERVLSSYPFQLSGGMCQRVMIAMALINAPSLLIADEPGTALDVTVQDQTLRLMRQLVLEHRAAVLLISHNLGIVREYSDRLYVIYRGRIVEQGATDSVFRDPRHAYTRALLDAVPRITRTGIPVVGEDVEAFSAPCEIHAEAA